MFRLANEHVRISVTVWRLAKSGCDSAGLGLQPLVQTPSRSSSLRRKGKCSAPCMWPCRLADPTSGCFGFVGLSGLFAPLGWGGGGGSSKPPTRPTTPTTERGDNPEDQVRGNKPKKLDIPPQTSGAKKGPGGWGRVRVMTKVLGLRGGRNPSQANDTGE